MFLSTTVFYSSAWKTVKLIKQLKRKKNSTIPSNFFVRFLGIPQDLAISLSFWQIYKDKPQKAAIMFKYKNRSTLARPGATYL
jgi:hypothetical protein